MIYTLEFEIPGLPPTQNGSHKGFRAAAKIRKEWRMAACVSAKSRRPPSPLKKVKLWVTRCSSVRTDFGNRVGAAKPILDGLVDAGIIDDDNDDVIIEQHYLHENVAKGKGKMRVRVEEIPCLTT